MSTLVGNIVIDIRAVHPEYPAHVIASALAIIAGSIILFIGLVRCGWIVDLIPLVSLSAFMTGSAINIAAGQVPGLLGTSSLFNTRDSTYLVIINTLKYLPKTQLDAAMGLTALFFLYLIRYTFNTLAKRYPSHERLYFFLNTLRTAFVILLYTLISWLVNMWHNTKPSFKILGNVPRGKASRFSYMRPS
jgi:solute carrier family 26 (sodium-independent sulfate anion transporter), member 11